MNYMYYKTFPNEEKGVVIVKAFRAKDELIDEVQNFCYENGLFLYADFFNKFFKKYSNSLDSLYGRATCNTTAGDTFNLEYGERLATERLEIKYNKLRGKIYEDLFNHLVKASGQTAKKIAKICRVTKI